MKDKILVILLLSFFHSSFAQVNYAIKGSIVDTANVKMPNASVFLLQPKDSSLVTFTRTDKNGDFSFKNLKLQDYLLKLTYIGYVPQQIYVKYHAEGLSVVGPFKMTIIQKELFEVVIKTAKAPMTFKGDTIEYDARKFKVPPGGSVEDLLKRLPGVTVDAEGNIRTQGEKVNRLLVDGKRFFGDDPKVATRMLPAEAINKVQVFNGASDQSKLTGIEDGKHEKTVNLELKEEFKKGGFGKTTVGAGSDDRLTAKANYNKFDAKNQFSVLGFGNNVNQTGLSRDDYQDFKGSQSYNWNNNADFGFSNSSMVSISFGSDDNPEDNLNIPQSFGPSLGFSKNYAGGLNYNYDTKNFKVSSNYFYNKTHQNVNANSFTQTFLDKINYSSNLNSSNANTMENHRMSFRVEKNLDSLNTLILNVDSKISNKEVSQTVLGDYLDSNQEVFRNQKASSNSNGSGLMLASSLIYRKKFKEKGKNFAFSTSFNKNSSDQKAQQNTMYNNLGIATNVFPINPNLLNINQNAIGNGNSNEIKSSLMFTYPFTKKIFLETFYNFSNLNRIGDRNIYNLNISANARLDSLSRYFENNILYNRIGSGLRYSFKGINLSFGMAAQQYNLSGKFYAEKNGTSLGLFKNNYASFVPNLKIALELKNNKFYDFSYNMAVNAPSLKDLQPYVDNSNPMYVSQGNPLLKPSVASNLSTSFYYYNPVTFKNFVAFISYNYYHSQIVYNQNVGTDLVTHLRPTNISGGQNSQMYYYYGFPIVKTKIASGLSVNLNINRNIMFVNDVQNINTNQNIYLGYQLDITPKDWFSWFINANQSFNTAKYSINTTQNQVYNTQSITSSTILQFPKLWFFTSDLNYNHYINNKLNLNRYVPILNLSVYKVFGKTKKSELRFSLYDAFKKNIGINQYASQNMISKNVTQTLSRYFMVTYTYNMRGVSTKVKKTAWGD